MYRIALLCARELSRGSVRGLEGMNRVAGCWSLSSSKQPASGFSIQSFFHLTSPGFPAKLHPPIHPVSSETIFLTIALPH